MGDDGGEFERFFRGEYRMVVATVVPIVGSVEDAEAVVQEAFLKAHVRWRRVRRLDRPGAWVRRIAIRDAVRAVPTQRPQGDSRPVSAIGFDGDLVQRLELDDALRQLPPNQRAAVALHYLAGWPAADIGDALGCAEATVRVHLHRGRQHLHDLLSAHSSTEELTDGR